jgi:hypothetical protein
MENPQSLDEIIVSKMTEASTLTSVKFTQACQVGVLFWGAQDNVYDPAQGIDNVIPFYPNRSVIRNMYADGLESMNVLRQIEIEKAEEIGIIDRMMNQVRTQWTMEKLAKIVRKRFEQKLMTGEMKVRTDKAFEVAPGKFRRPF